MAAAACPECGGAMRLGYLGDRSQSGITAAFWVEGEPETARFLGLSAGLKVTDRARYDVTTFRCEGCGLLKSYARPQDRC